MLLGDIFDERSIKLNLEARTKDAVFAELVGAIRAAHPEFDAEAMLAAIIEREQKMSAGVADGIAIPHCCCEGFTANPCLSGCRSISLRPGNPPACPQ